MQNNDIRKETFVYRDTGMASADARDLAASAVNAMTIALNGSWEENMDCLFRQAHTLGLMPADRKCVEAMLREKGFVLQPGKKDKPTLEEVRQAMSKQCRSGEIAVALTPLYCHYGHMTALMPHCVESTDQIVYKLEDTMDRRNWEVNQLWIRWPDGEDHSPVKRRSGTRKATQKAVKLPEETESFAYFQPNPLGNRIGDCTLRALSAVCEIDWHEALDRFRKHNCTVTNRDDQIRQTLIDSGLSRYQLPAPKTRLTAAQFCDRMSVLAKKGERFYLWVGDSHVAAALPYEQEDGSVRYRITDSWDCTKRYVKECWVKVSQQEEPAEKKEAVFLLGARLLHPGFGEGTIRKMQETSQCILLEVEFEAVGSKMLAGSWVKENCTSL